MLVGINEYPKYVKKLKTTISTEKLIYCENREYILLNQQINVYNNKNRLIIRSYLNLI